MVVDSFLVHNFIKSADAPQRCLSVQAFSTPARVKFFQWLGGNWVLVWVSREGLQRDELLHDLNKKPYTIFYNNHKHRNGIIIVRNGIIIATIEIGNNFAYPKKEKLLKDA